MASCDKVKDIQIICDSNNLNLSKEFLAIRYDAIKYVKNTTNPFLLDDLSVVDLATGVYPISTSEYYPVKVEFYLNSVKPNYEVVEGTSTAIKYLHTIGNVVVTDSENALGKLNINGLTNNLWIIVAKVKGVNNANDSFHVYGLGQGMKFLPAPTSDEFGGRVVGMFKSIAGAEENTPNGLNWLDTTIANTETLFKQRLNPVII